MYLQSHPDYCSSPFPNKNRVIVKGTFTEWQRRQVVGALEPRENFFFCLPKWLSSAQKSLQDPRCSNPATHAHRAAGHKRQGWDAQTFSTRQPRRRRQSSASLSRGYIRSVCLICYVLLLKRASFQLLGRISEYYCSIAGFTFRPFFWCRRALAKCIYVYQCNIECQFQL